MGIESPGTKKKKSTIRQHWIAKKNYNIPEALEIVDPANELRNSLRAIAAAVAMEESLMTAEPTRDTDSSSNSSDADDKPDRERSRPLPMVPVLPELDACNKADATDLGEASSIRREEEIMSGSKRYP
jgi:hypothetical protein